jgi:hypothetical protein
MPTPRLERARRSAAAAVTIAGATMLLGCGSTRPATTVAPQAPIPPALVAEARPIGHGPRFHPPATGPVIGPCRPGLGRRFGVHVELFAANRVVLIAAAIGTVPPRTLSAGRISGARCFGALVTLEPTGVVLVRSGDRLALGSLFRSWGQPLSTRRLASFDGRVSAFVDGRRWPAAAASVPLTRHAEIVLEVGPHVPPHSSYTFPPGL